MISKVAQLALVLIGVCLLVPTLGMGLQTTESLEGFHNRTLRSWPETAAFMRDPARYFLQANQWLADRVYPVISATYLKNNVAYLVLRASPASNITVGRGGFVFMNGTEADAENDLVINACARAADPVNRARIEAALGRFAGFGREHGYAIDVVMVPTLPVLYGDRLPRSFPSALRQACSAGPAGRPPLSHLRAPDGLHFVYPFDDLSILRNDSAMFPMGNFHPDGLSVKTVTDAYLRAIGGSKPMLSVTLTSGLSEVLAGDGVEAPFPVYAVTGSSSIMDEATMSRMIAAVLPFYDGPGEAAYVYRNMNALNRQTILVVSDSFGFNQGINLASAFRNVIQLSAPDRDLPLFIEAVETIMHFDRLVLVFNDSNFGRLISLSELLSVPLNH